MKAQKKENFYLQQNRAIHKARAQLAMSLDDCRELARQLSGNASLSSLTAYQRWQLVEELRAKGARVFNPPLPEGDEKPLAPEDVYPARLEYWKKRFPNPRPGYATPYQLAWIQTLYELNFDRGHGMKGLRRFIYRQTKCSEGGPVSDLAFLRDYHLEALVTPLKEKALSSRATMTQYQQGGIRNAK